MTASVSCAGKEPGGYAHLVAVQRHYATVAAEDPERQQLREQLIRGYLPLAERVALGNAMQCPDLRPSCGAWAWMIVGCCCYRSCTGSCAVYLA